MRLTKRGKERLLKLAEILSEPIAVKAPNGEVPRFILESWVVVNCKTQACAFGEAALHPWFRRRGLTLKKGASADSQYYPTYEGEEGDWAAMRFFGINRHDVKRLFYPAAYSREHRGRRHVARRIRRFVRNKERDAA